MSAWKQVVISWALIIGMVTFSLIGLGVTFKPTRWYFIQAAVCAVAFYFWQRLKL